MDINKILEELRREHAQLEEAILSLERLAVGGKRRGRPPAWLAAAAERTDRPAPAAMPSVKGRRGRKKGPGAESSD